MKKSGSRKDAAKPAETPESAGLAKLGVIFRNARKNAGIAQKALVGDNAKTDSISRIECGTGVKRVTFEDFVRKLNDLLPSKQHLNATKLWEEHVFKPQIGTDSAQGTAAQVAYRIWWELSTRQIALALDPENDVMEEVFNSWYVAFDRIRLHTADLPFGTEAEEMGAVVVLNHAQKLLNGIMRPVLTRWQAEFRAWRAIAVTSGDYVKLRPQELDRKFPKHAALMQDFNKTNDAVIELQEQLRQFVFGKAKT
jgi:hypothetical protein